MIKSTSRLLAQCLLLFFVMAGTAFAGGVVRIAVMEVEDPAKYVAEVERGREIVRRLGAKVEISVLQAKFAGSETGTVITMMKFADLEQLASDTAIMGSDPGYREWHASLGEVRTVVSDSLYTELTD